MSKQVSVFTVSANDRLQSAFAELLGRHSRLYHAGSSPAVGDALLRISAAAPPHVVMSDSPPTNVYDMLMWREIRAFKPRLLMLANYLRESDGVLAILAGASALILPSMGSRQGLVDAILRVAKGESILPNGVITRLNGFASNATGRLDEEERRVLRLITEGSTDEEIAAKEAVPLGQVRSWVAGIGEKLS